MCLMDCFAQAITYEVFKFVILQNPTDNLVVNFFQLLLSLRNASLDPNNGAVGKIL